VPIESIHLTPTLPMNENVNLPEEGEMYPDGISAMGLGLFIWGLFLSYWMLFEAF
jgi:hypothetical protein